MFKDVCLNCILGNNVWILDEGVNSHYIQQSCECKFLANEKTSMLNEKNGLLALMAMNKYGLTCLIAQSHSTFLDFEVSILR